MFVPGDLVTVKPEFLSGWQEEFAGNIGEVLRVSKPYDPFNFDYVVYFPGTFRSNGEFGFDHEELDEFCAGVDTAEETG